jgi:hypothetical protein
MIDYLAEKGHALETLAIEIRMVVLSPSPANVMPPATPG